MRVYQRRELWLLLGFVLALAVGSLIQHLRHGFPELVERLESVDQEDDASPPALSAPHSHDGLPSRPQKLSRDDRLLNLNQAAVDDLQRLPGIGPTLAKRIVEAREQRGRFLTLDDLLTVPGIGTKKFEAIKELVTVGPPNDG